MYRIALSQLFQEHLSAWSHQHVKLVLIQCYRLQLGFYYISFGPVNFSLELILCYNIDKYTIYINDDVPSINRLYKL